MNACKIFGVTLLSALAVVVGGCAAGSESAPVAPVASESILASSNPAAGATVAAPLNSLELHFKPPARLDELTVSGPGGTMPTMVHAVGEVADYSIPLSALGPGRYTVNWKAFAANRQYQGSFAFTVK